VAQQPALLADGLRCGYASAEVIHGVTLLVNPGEVVVLLGPNGAGKTTILLTLSGLLRPTGGIARVLGSDVRGRAPHDIARRGLAHVPQDRSLFPDLTVRQHLRLAARTRAGADGDVLALLPELDPLLDRRVGVLSGGEQQLVALARGLASRPRVVMADEFTAGVAPAIAARVLAWLHAQAATKGLAVLIVEQHVSLALRHADRAYVLVQGSIVAEGTATELAAKRDVLEMAYLGKTV
jgi:branched-chain amino acid transport system ATP-binding protein